MSISPHRAYERQLVLVSLSKLPNEKKRGNRRMKKGFLTMAGMLLTVSLVSAGTTVPVLADEETTLVYGSGDYTRINPAMEDRKSVV